jgi:hypothetical protein
LAAQTLSGLDAQKVWISLDEDDQEFQSTLNQLS